MNIKFLILMLISVLGIIGFAIFISGSNKNTKASVTKTLGAKFSADHDFKIIGDIKYSKGIYYHNFPIKNSGTKDLEIANINSSCACTKAFIRLNGKDSPGFGMKGMSAPSSWKGIIKPGESGEVIAAFDPAFHGPQGVGKISRTVSFETNDPDNPYVELSFEGVVSK